MGKAKTLKQVIQENRDEIMKIPGVVGIAAGLSRSGSGKKCILVYITTNEPPDGLPLQIDGYAVETIRKRKLFNIF